MREQLEQRMLAVLPRPLLPERPPSAQHTHGQRLTPREAHPARGADTHFFSSSSCGTQRVSDAAHGGRGDGTHMMGLRC
jgi:hypothetical protein